MLYGALGPMSLNVYDEKWSPRQSISGAHEPSFVRWRSGVQCEVIHFMSEYSILVFTNEEIYSEKDAQIISFLVGKYIYDVTLVVATFMMLCLPVKIPQHFIVEGIYSDILIVEHPTNKIF